VTVHAAQMLAGMLLAQDEERPSSTAAALPALAAARRRGIDDDTIVARAPIVLALVPPRIGDAVAPPDVPSGEIAGRFPPSIPTLAPREALRLRARWLDELAARAATELGRRLAADGRLTDRDDVRELKVAELEGLVGGGAQPDDLAARRDLADGPPLPAAFRRTPSGTVVAVRAEAPVGRGAGGGRGAGTVVHAGDAPPGAGQVLVTRVLSPSLAATLPGLAGLIAETGSTLSHLAILAREHGVPTVVGVADALERYPVGCRVLVDGTTGEIRRLDGTPEERGAP
jgi:pyruvate,water dikinase